MEESRKPSKLKLGEILCQIAGLSPQQIEESLYSQIVDGQSSNKMLGEILIGKGYATKEDVETALAMQYGYPYLVVSNYDIQPDALKLIPKEIAIKHSCIPLEKMADVLVVAMASPFEKITINEFLQSAGYKIRIFLSRHKEINEMIYKYYSAP